MPNPKWIIYFSLPASFQNLGVNVEDRVEDMSVIIGI